MGLASGSGSSGGGGGGGGFFFYHGGRSSGDGQIGVVGGILAGVVAVAAVGGIVAACVVDCNSTKQIKEERAQCEAVLAEHAGVQNFALSYFDWTTEESDYFFTFTGSATKKDGQPIDFIATKYKVSQQHYYEMVSYIEENKVEGLDHKKGLFPKIIEVLNVSELVSNSAAEVVANGVYDKESGEMAVIQNITNPKVNEENGTVEYEVDLAKFNLKDSGNSSMTFITKKVSVPLTKELSTRLSAVFLSQPKDCTVETIGENTVEVKNNKDLMFQNGNTYSLSFDGLEEPEM